MGLKKNKKSIKTKKGKGLRQDGLKPKSKKGIKSKITDISEAEENNNTLVYGKSGCGKTTFFSSWPGKKLLINIDKEKGTDSVSDVPMDVISIETTQEVEDLYWYLHSNPGLYASIAFDTVSRLQLLRVRETLEAKGENTEGNIQEWGRMKQQDWGKVSGWMNTWIDNFSDLDCRIVFLAQEKTKNAKSDDDDNDSDTSVLAPEVGPAIMPSVANMLEASVNIIVNTFIRDYESTEEVAVKGFKNKKKVTTKENQYCLRVGPHPYYITKVRKPMSVKLPDVIVNPTYKKLMSAKKG